MKIKNMTMLLILPALVLAYGCGNKTHKDVMLDIYEKDGYEKASDYIDSLEDPTEKIDLIYTLGAKESGITEEEFKTLVYKDSEVTQGKLEIVEITIKDGKLNLRVKNNTSDDIGYFKYDIFFEDKDGNILDSDWSNCDKTILVGAEAITETYISKPEGTKRTRVEIVEIK